MDFHRVLSTALEFVRVVNVFEFQPPPPTHTFRSLEPLYKSTIQHYQEQCVRKYDEIQRPKVLEDGEMQDLQDARFGELEELLEKHFKLIKNLDTMLHYPHLKSRKHSDDTPDELDVHLGPQRYIEKPYIGYGFSNDYIRRWLAAIPGPLGQHFEKEEASRSNLTRIFQQILLALIAGAALLVPMIIMMFKNSNEARLIIVCVATILFGISFAIVSSTKENILAGTAAYAAVMVVYIGSATSGGNGGGGSGGGGKNG